MEVKDIKFYEVFHLHLNNYAGQMVTRVPVTYTINLKKDKIITPVCCPTPQQYHSLRRMVWSKISKSWVNGYALRLVLLLPSMSLASG